MQKKMNAVHTLRCYTCPHRVKVQNHANKGDLLAWCEVAIFVVHSKTQYDDVGQCQRCALGCTLTREGADKPVVKEGRILIPCK